MILEDRLLLAEHIMGLWYPSYCGVWLKAVPTPDVTDAGLRARWVAAGDRAQRRSVEHDVLQRLLSDHFYNWTPEDSPYSEFLAATWRPLTRDELPRHVDPLFTEAARRISEVQAQEAEERAEAEAGGWSDELPPPRFAGDMIDLPALRRWFLSELWIGARPSWWTTEGSRGCRPAYVGLDEYLIAILWLP